jgi:hypothetical protein
MGRRPRSGDIPWPPAHSILNWIGGDIYMLVPLMAKSSGNRDHRRKVFKNGTYWAVKISR